MIDVQIENVTYIFYNYILVFHLMCCNRIAYTKQVIKAREIFHGY